MKLIPNLAPIDLRAKQDLGIPSLLLMEEAGRRVALRVSKLADQRGLKMPVVTVVCGKGQNGGDGFVCARRLAMTGLFQVNVVYAAPPQELQGDTLVNFNLLRLHPVHTLSGLMHDRVADLLARTDIVVDALFGSGLSRPIEGTYRELVNQINDCGAFCVAVDLPSGIHSATGDMLGVAVRADYTVTFAAPKPGLYLFPGKGCTGDVEVVDIGIPPVLLEEDTSRIFLITPRMVRNRLPQRQGLSHKYSYGSVLVIAGSRDMPGAAVMAAEAALRAGAGLVRLAAPHSAFERMTLSPEILCLSLPESDTGVLGPEALAPLIHCLEQAETIAVGPGLGIKAETLAFMDALLNHLRHKTHQSVVLDADALNALAQLPQHHHLSSRFILTPHLGECARLLDQPKERLTHNLLASCQNTAQKYSATVILKSASTVIHGSEGRLWINPTGNAGLATAGSGDVLTGLIAGFSAQGLVPDRSARVATYLHGLAGDKAAQAMTMYSMNATDILRFLPQALQDVMA